MQLHFNAISEPGLPGKKWRKLYNIHWAAYRLWLDSKKKDYEPDLKTSQAALKKYMPEMWPTYKRLCKIAKADEVGARFLTGFQPPAYLSACSNAVISGDEIQLVRNYDYHPDLMEGTQLLSAWNGKKVIGTSDCLIGLLDGMNEDGLAVSLTFGGRKEVGEGFGIPFILRYVLEFCSNVEEAVAALIRIPSHMSYNVTVVDKSGAFKTVRLAPDREAVVTKAAFTTNHQGAVDWPENATFNKTLERSSFLEKMLATKGINAAKIVDAFQKKPLYNKRFNEGFGTLFTAVYRPGEGIVEMRWPGIKISQTFDSFQEQFKLIEFEEASERPAKIIEDELSSPYEWKKTVSGSLANSLAQVYPSVDKKQVEQWRGELINKGEISWEVLADFWSNKVTKYWTARDN